jgi:hypothetical protein
MTNPQEIESRVPGLRLGDLFARSIKCELYAGALDGREVVVKCLARDVAPWRWYFERECALLDAFRATNERAETPELLAMDAARGWMVVAKIDGVPLAQGRFAHDATEATVRAALAARRRWSETTTPLPPLMPDTETRREMRERLLEDPHEGLAWCTEGLARGATLALIDENDAARAIEALRAWPVRVRSHGDLLPRNVMVTGDGARLVDLECAGEHAEGWDHALLRVNVPDALGAVVDEDFGAGDARRVRAYRACVVFALVRERKFVRGSRREGAIAERLREAVAAL